MAQRRNHHGNKRPNRPPAKGSPAERVALTPLPRKPPVVYGEPIVVLEDAQKSTFIYKSGRWIPHSKTIAECREDSKVTELPQKIKGMTRYEIRTPLEASD